MSDTYLVIESKSLSTLADKVNAEIERGYDVQGGICAVSVISTQWSHSKIQYSQAMVKKDA